MLKRGVGAAARRRTTSNFVRNARTKNNVYLRVNHIGVQCRFGGKHSPLRDNPRHLIRGTHSVPINEHSQLPRRETPRDPNRQRLSRFKQHEHGKTLRNPSLYKRQLD